MTAKLPKIVLPRPVKWGKPKVRLYLPCPQYRVEVYAPGGLSRHGPRRKTKAAAIRAWNKQEGKP